jgi:hypothetical protein
MDEITTDARRNAEAAEEALAASRDTYGRVGVSPDTKERYHRLTLDNALVSIAQSLVDLTAMIAEGRLSELPELDDDLGDPPMIPEPTPRLADLPDGTPIP